MRRLFSAKPFVVHPVLPLALWPAVADRHAAAAPAQLRGRPPAVSTRRQSFLAGGGRTTLMRLGIRSGTKSGLTQHLHVRASEELRREVVFDGMKARQPVTLSFLCLLPVLLRFVFVLQPQVKRGNAVVSCGNLPRVLLASLDVFLVSLD
jgi:hypothetical protein